MKRQIVQFSLAALLSGAVLSAQRPLPFDTTGGSLGSAQNSADAIARLVHVAEFLQDAVCGESEAGRGEELSAGAPRGV